MKMLQIAQKAHIHATSVITTATGESATSILISTVQARMGATTHMVDATIAPNIANVFISFFLLC